MRCLTGARLHRADFGAPLFDPSLDRITNLTDLFEPGLFAPLENRGIGKGPRQLDRHTGKDRTGPGLSFRLTANRHDIGERVSRFPDIKNPSCAFMRNVDADLSYYLNRKLIDQTRFRARARASNSSPRI